MKPAPFEYHAPTGVGEAVRLLSELGEDARPLAGGQSLVPLMALRLARPTHLVDLNPVEQLGTMDVAADGSLRIGSMVRQATAERSPLVADRCPLMAEAIPFMSHTAIRSRGTIGGSLAHGDPAAELPAVCAALEAELVVRSAAGERTVRPADFFVSHFTTALETGELLAEIRVPQALPRTGWAFDEVSRREGDFALVAAAAMVRLEGDVIAEARLAFAGMGSVPVRAVAAESLLAGEKPAPELFERAAQEAVAGLDPPGDLHATPEYRAHVAGALSRRVLASAARRAGEQP
jgi:carbon-monoxide dehydrogenase medium subunit